MLIILVRQFRQPILNSRTPCRHNKTILYFGHGGLNGLNEAIKFRKLTVAMPVWSDGEDTVNKLVKRGACVSVPKDSDADAIYEAIVGVLDDPG